MLLAQQVCPLDINSSAIDYQVITANDEQDCDGESEGGIEGVLVVATDQAIQQKTELVSEASAKCVLMDIDDLALLNCFCECEKPDAGKAIVIIDVGNCFTTVSILGGDGIPFIRTFSFAGRDIIKKLTEENDLTVKVVSDALRDSEKKNFDLGAGLESACKELVTGINETLRYYLVQPGATGIERVFVCGGFALCEGFIELLNRKLFVKVQLWDPFTRMDFDANIPGAHILKTIGPVMAVSAGLAMRSI